MGDHDSEHQLFEGTVSVREQGENCGLDGSKKSTGTFMVTCKAKSKWDIYRAWIVHTIPAPKGRYYITRSDHPTQRLKAHHSHCNRSCKPSRHIVSQAWKPKHVRVAANGSDVNTTYPVGTMMPEERGADCMGQWLRETVGIRWEGCHIRDR